MKGVQEKRANFREEIRRRYINNMFREVRQKFNNQHRDSFNTIDQTVYEQYSSTLHQVLLKIITLKKQANFKAITNEIITLISIAQQKLEVLSFCLNQEIRDKGQYFIDSVKKDVPLSVLGDLDDEDGGEMEEKIEEEEIGYDELVMIVNILKLAEKLQIHKFSQESMILILKMFWNVVSNNYHMNTTEHTQIHSQILQLWLICLNKLINSPHERLMRKHMKQLGIASILNNLIDVSHKFTNESHYYLLEFINSYVRPDTQSTDDLVGGIVVLGHDIESKTRYVCYCVYLIRKNMEFLLLPCLSILDQMFSQYGYLVEHLNIDEFQPILKLVSYADRQISVAALDVLNTIAFFSDNICDAMMELPTNILDVIYNRLMFESSLPIQEPYTKKSVDKCTNVLCDLLLTNTSSIKKILFDHAVWQFIYQNINEESPLFSTVIVFKYFFPCFGRTKSLKVLPSILDAFSNLPLQNTECQEIKDVKMIMQLVLDEAAQFWPQNEYDIVVGMLEQRGLLKFVQGDDLIAS